MDPNINSNNGYNFSSNDNVSGYQRNENNIIEERSNDYENFVILDDRIEPRSISSLPANERIEILNRQMEALNHYIYNSFNHPIENFPLPQSNRSNFRGRVGQELHRMSNRSPAPYLINEVAISISSEMSPQVSRLNNSFVEENVDNQSSEREGLESGERLASESSNIPTLMQDLIVTLFNNPSLEDLHRNLSIHDTFILNPISSESDDDILEESDDELTNLEVCQKFNENTIREEEVIQNEENFIALKNRIQNFISSNQIEDKINIPSLVEKILKEIDLSANKRWVDVIDSYLSSLKNWDLYSNALDDEEDWDYYQPFEYDGFFEKFIINGTINHYKHPTINNPIIEEIRFRTDRVNAYHNFMILVLKSENLNQYKDYFEKFLFLNLKIEFSNLNSNIPKLYIPFPEVRNILKKLEDDKFIKTNDLSIVIRFVNEMERCLKYIDQRADSITIAQKDIIEAMIEPYIENKNIPTYLLELTSKILAKNSAKTKEEIKKYLFQEIKGVSQEEFINISIEEEEFYECLIDLAKIYSSLSHLEDALEQQTGGPLPSEKIIQKIIRKKIKTKI